MLNCAILDDYQDCSLSFADWDSTSQAPAQIGHPEPLDNLNGTRTGFDSLPVVTPRATAGQVHSRIAAPILAQSSSLDCRHTATG